MSKDLHGTRSSMSLDAVGRVQYITGLMKRHRDNVVHTYSTNVSNSYGYSSEATYDYRFGQMLTSKDLNGNEITYELDNLGRVKYITGPYEQGGGNKTIEFDYHPEAQIPWALTKHYDPPIRRTSWRR